MIPEPNTGCWLWTNRLDRYGYGQLNKKPFRTAHRASYFAFKGEIPDGMLVCHKCDTRACINPDHLWLGTNLENNRDCSKKGRKSKTHCINGHEFTADNTYIKKYKNRESKSCKKCILERLKSDHYVAKRKQRHSIKNTQEYKDKMAKKRREYNATRKEHLKTLRREYRLKNLEKIRQQERQRSRNK